LIASQLPSPHSEYWTGPAGGDVEKIKTLLAPRAILSLFCSVLIGAATHIVWDSFTHIHGRAVDSVPLLSSDLVSVGRVDLKVYKFLQYFSSVAGLAIVQVLYKKELSKQPHNNQAHQYKSSFLRFWILVGLSTLLAVMLVDLIEQRPRTNHYEIINS